MQNPETTKLVKEPTKTKMVKIKVLKPISLGNDTVINPSENVIEVTEEQAAEYCDKKLQGPFAFSGERYEEDGEVRRHNLTRAVRVV